MYDLIEIPDSAPTGFAYMAVFEVGSELKIWLTNSPRIFAHEVMMNETNVGRLWVSPLTFTPVPDAVELIEHLNTKNVKINGNILSGVSLDDVARYVTDEIGFGLELGRFYDNHMPSEV